MAKPKKPLDVLAQAAREAMEDVGAQALHEGVAFVHELMHKRTGHDAYEILGVDPDDPIDVVRAVYHAKAKHYHPDNLETGDAERFKLIQRAYEAIAATFQQDRT